MEEHLEVQEAIRQHPIQPPGRNYINCAPLSSKVRLGSPTDQPCKILNDVCSNISLIDSELLTKRYPNSELDATIKLDVKGIGKAQTMGHVKIPLWLEGAKDNGERCLIKLEGEFHIVKNFEYGILMGIDMITDYGIDLHISKNQAVLPRFSYEIESVKTKFQSVLIRVKSDLTVQGRMCQAVLIKSHMSPGKDYIFSSYQFLQAGQVVAPSLSLPYALINADTKFLMFQNTSVMPITLK